MRCDADHLFDEMFFLSERLEEGKISTEETVRLRLLYDGWVKTNCAYHCQPGSCRFRRPDVYWIEKHGLVHLADFLLHLEQEEYETRPDGVVKINERKQDALDVRKSRMPGSYGSRQ